MFVDENRGGKHAQLNSNAGCECEGCLAVNATAFSYFKWVCTAIPSVWIHRLEILGESERDSNKANRERNTNTKQPTETHNTTLITNNPNTYNSTSQGATTHVTASRRFAPSCQRLRRVARGVLRSRQSSGTEINI